MTLSGFKLCATAVLACITFSQTGQADDSVKITQKGKQFSEKKVAIKTGQDIVFVNDDNVAHNVYTIVNGKKRDLGLQKPTEEGSIAFDAPGTYRVRCAIHPKMKLVVKVTDGEGN
ncbi:MAG: cupredoxin domain-containing protein [Kordiimonas sp.]